MAAGPDGLAFEAAALSVRVAAEGSQVFGHRGRVDQVVQGKRTVDQKHRGGGEGEGVDDVQGHGGGPCRVWDDAMVRDPR